MLKVNELSGGYDGKQIVKNMTFHVEKGKILGILGPNGSGKSTLLKMISGVLKPTRGGILIEDRPINSYDIKQLAKKMAVLPQLNASVFTNSVYDAVSLGRYPHQSGFFSTWSKEDENLVQRAMESTGVSHYRNQHLEFLSGGEQQRVFIAQALAQDSELLLLDEPTNHLDIAHQKQILDMIRMQVELNGLTVVSIFHDINLASLYCDELLLIENGEIRAFGEPHEVIMQDQIADVYKARIVTYPHPELPKPQITMLPTNELERKKATINKKNFIITDEYVKYNSPSPLKVISSAVHNAGMGWYDTFLNRAIAPEYDIYNVKEETEQFLRHNRFSPTNTVVMLTAVKTKCAAIQHFSKGNVEISVMVTAGIGNGVDVTKAYLREDEPHIGTINTWVFINGKLTDEAFIQAMITATEAKTKALADQQIKDPLTNTTATSTATDSLLIAATQQGEEMPYAGPITEVGKLIGRAVFEVTVSAIIKYKEHTIL
ncbi:adenosylcobinamide amidohydrolase [Solibacillus merdavium]|uniref:Adenosylcobinamide amidohydrolase n=1 Tax=Solibacillus merdavium TaxID=2762218 RepID=A0ABR8XL21_9BACL|nr:adenosylcobinamide amidohydrolase [Solibacillus merdavium]MBD8032637.1 adenosylcobinamide amidohydrolase [Solibacillus merdavium]